MDQPPPDDPAHQLGPRQQELLEGWRRTVQTAPSGLGYDFTRSPVRVDLESAIDTFVAEPSSERFSDFWDTLTRTTTPYSYVLGKWPGSIESLAEFLDEVRTATTWDPGWASEFRSPTWLYELFSRTHDTYPVIDTHTQTHLRRFGIRISDDFQGHIDGMERFQTAYEATVGHVTADTAYEVPITRELDELFGLLHQFDPAELAPRLLGRETPVYEPLIGFAATSHDGGQIELNIDLVETVIDAYVEGVEAGAYGIDPDLPEAEREAHWCGTYDEQWKHEAAESVSTVLRDEVDGTALSSEDLDRVIEVFDEGHGVISAPVIQYLLNPRQGWRVWDAFKERTQARPENAAAVLSRFFDPEAAYVTGRLDLFDWFYGDGEDLHAGALMKLATGLLMLAWPERYVLYQYGRCSSFFDDVCVSAFEVETGYNPAQYHRINVAAEELRLRVDERLSRPATMCDIQSIFYFWHDEPLA